MRHLRNSFTACLFLIGWSALWVPRIWAAEAHGPQVSIPAGEFQMGMQQGTPWERPVHKVWVDAFDIDRYEVSNKSYETFQPGHRRSGRSSCDDCPVTLVDWHEAEAFCQHREGRLPTEAEWEKTARGPEDWDYSFGEQPDPEHGHFGKDFQTGTVKVFAPSRNKYAVSHMSGNVWEWTADWFGPYSKGSVKNPVGPATGFQKVVRGGSWYSPAYYVHVGMRFKLAPNVRLNSVGFRCAYDVLGGSQ